MDPPVPLEAVITTATLNQRPSRPADHAAVNSAMVALMREMANSPRTILQRIWSILRSVFAKLIPRVSAC
jgi:hypothetical protein